MAKETYGTDMKKDPAHLCSFLPDFSLAFLISLVWVTLYGYRYNIPFFNSPHVNWFSLALWTLGLFGTIGIYRFFALRVSRLWVLLIMIWIIFFLGLLAVEFIGYYILGIHLVTSSGPLVFGLIHGTATLKIYYMTVGPGTVLLTAILEKIGTSLRNAERYVKILQKERG
jgi:hypothetical protein